MLFSNAYFGDKVRLYASLPSAFFRHAATLLEYLRETEEASPQWMSVLLVYLGMVDKADVELRDGSKFCLTKETLHRFIGAVQSYNTDISKYKGMKIKLDDGFATFKIRGMDMRAEKSSLSAVLGEFTSDFHNVEDVEGRVVLDVGAYMGETAMLYAMMGRARHVYAFEPVRYLYLNMVKNIKLNNLQSRITPINAMLVGHEPKRMERVRSNPFGPSKNVKMISLNEFVKRIDIRNGMLKLDCEGGEYEIIKNSPSSTLNRFKIIHVEYHYGYRDIFERFKAEGMAVSYTKPGVMAIGMSSGIRYGGDIVARNRKASLD